ncbi:MAG: hypothetical protein Q8916_00230 [Bacteroidota bacterium]|nr:hypothetical protein [Bacteroidota bacterium]MDP4228813.1 hypothetical protein [Bacteroidota bacterium]MDP4235596.1 hypothetical protein [Bacteroidota bacterium]
MKTNYAIAILLLSSILLVYSDSNAQTGDVIDPNTDQSLPTLLSLKLSGGYGIGRARQDLGSNGTNPVWWSAGQGVKMDLALDIPLLPIEVINSDGDENEPQRFSIVGLEMELGTGYHISTGGVWTSGSETTTPTYTYVPVTLGFNARATFGAGMPSVYIGAGGGVHLKAIYEDNTSIANSSTAIKKTYDPPIPFELYGLMGLEIPLMYSTDDGNSMLDLFVQARLTEVTNYIYKYTVTTTTPTTITNGVVIAGNGFGQTASNAAFSIGLKYNLY